MISLFLTKDFKKSLLPVETTYLVKHDNLFRQDFVKVTDQVIKEQIATNKIVHFTKPQNFAQPSVSSYSQERKHYVSSSGYSSKTYNTSQHYKNPN